MRHPVHWFGRPPQAAGYASAMALGWAGGVSSVYACCPGDNPWATRHFDLLVERRRGCIVTCRPRRGQVWAFRQSVLFRVKPEDERSRQSIELERLRLMVLWRIAAELYPQRIRNRPCRSKRRKPAAENLLWSPGCVPTGSNGGHGPCRRELIVMEWKMEEAGCARPDSGGSMLGPLLIPSAMATRRTGALRASKRRRHLGARPRKRAQRLARPGCACALRRRSIWRVGASPGQEDWDHHGLWRPNS